MIAGVVLTGGGAQLKHLRQLMEYMTGMSTRIGYPNEHLANSKVEDVTSPLFATGVGLVLTGFDFMERRRPHEAEPHPRSRAIQQAGQAWAASSTRCSRAPPRS